MTGPHKKAQGKVEPQADASYMIDGNYAQEGESIVRKGGQLSKFQAYRKDRERRTSVALSAIEKAGPEAALIRCRALARQIQSDLLNKKPDQFVNALSLANFQVSLERAVSVLEQKIQPSSTEKPTPATVSARRRALA